MRIALDISQIVYEGTGVARFTEGLVKSIIRSKKNHTWIFFFQTFRRKLKKELLDEITSNGFPYHNLFIPPRVSDVWWNHLHMYSIDNLIPDLDWYISSDWSEPPANCKKATIVHDLVFRKYPETVDSYVRAVMQRKIHWVAKEDSVIFADSYATKNDLEQYYNVKGKIVVNYPGVTPLPKDPSLTKETIEKKFKIDKPFFIAVGKREPRKNLDALIEAFKELNNENILLLIVGQEGWGDEIKRTKNVHFTGYVTDSELRKLYEMSIGLIFPSLYEGFGFPAVEAMQLGTPVALSNTSSLAEIGDKAALLFNPTSISSITTAMHELLDKSTRDQLKKKGLEKAEKYTWDTYLYTLERTIESA